jgi:hypothetical protein
VLSKLEEIEDVDDSEKVNDENRNEPIPLLISCSPPQSKPFPDKCPNEKKYIDCNLLRRSLIGWHTVYPNMQAKYMQGREKLLELRSENWYL